MHKRKVVGKIMHCSLLNLMKPTCHLEDFLSFIHTNSIKNIHVNQDFIIYLFKDYHTSSTVWFFPAFFAL